ncbi:metal-binding protein [Paramesorhizobium deserti]|uniref:Metal-binding protein n=1 Tax=Paramesorhizobium deserti TaxID=1494590 RepID=A0A135HZB3_9HYPH|nr:DUF411 domain-containing protein [Paramesorhizobium deserti]KXF78503.1 metal-binding protein [Paramesorhizobium deserti]
MSNFAKTFALASFILSSAPAMAGEKDVTLYKDPYCGCCTGHADYLKENGFNVTVKPTDDVAEMSRKAGIPEGAEGCHIAFIDGYFVSGHVPVGAINKLLTERPDIKGITLPGMPAGSPGMGGTKEAPFEVMEIRKPGELGGVYAKE